MQNEIPNCFYRVSAKALILDDTRQKFLVVREDKGGWDLPGGGIDWGETTQDCLKREITEEMGLVMADINASPSYVLIGHHKNSTWIMGLVCEVKVKDLNFIPTPECREIKFISPDEVGSIEALEPVKQLVELFDVKKHG